MTSTPISNGKVYEIRLKGHLDARWASLFEGMEITRIESGETLISGLVIDQAALYGLLKRIRDLGLSLISINFLDPNTKEKK